MKLIKIDGKIWDLTILQDDYHANDTYPHFISIKEKNIRSIEKQTWNSGIVRVLENNKVKSKAIACIEIIVNGFPQQNSYDIYHNSKGFYCNVQGRRVFLKDLLDEDFRRSL